MSTVERLTHLLTSDKLSIEEKQAIKDAIRLIQGFQADRIAAYEANAVQGRAGIMEKEITQPLRLDNWCASNWKPDASPVAILNEASTLHERIAFCWGLACGMHELSLLLSENASSDVGKVSNIFGKQLGPLVELLERLGADTFAEEAKKSGES